jgi:Protein of unknown function (DUF3147)
MDYVVRFVAGGLIVSVFAMIGDILRPKSFAGLFGAAPSVALVTLPLAFLEHGGGYVAIEARSMMLGAVAFVVYSVLVCQLLMRVRCSALAATLTATVAWLAVALGLKQILLG